MQGMRRAGGSNSNSVISAVNLQSITVDVYVFIDAASGDLSECHDHSPGVEEATLA